MGVIGYIVGHFVLSRVHGKTRLRVGGALAVTFLVLAFFTYFATYYMPPEGLEESEVLSRIAEMNARRLFLVVGEAVGRSHYLFRVYRRSLI
jgi:hypothetical protein